MCASLPSLLVVVVVIMNMSLRHSDQRSHTMTNAEIIRNAKLMNGITEDAHTFAHWKQPGYCVRKGGHAKFSAVIWKCAKSKRAKAIEDETGEKQPASMFMKKAYFFTASQVDALATA